ncbi:hypothetical protein [Pseudomonas sp. URMO17WK12:I12]|mgnify:CR=1 FL=1|jgi:hypothetical protein|uniref:hypothetical protein n=1 Tax=Pseudomonas sp. URMO17WK12:I12 TaxID=1259797 RepID=UPI000484D258|nr:hypothetical protein [Pseudomonas sp. URMO17WK12:I12]
MQMSEAVEVIQVAGASSANTKLAEGWKLLAVTSAGNGQNDGKTFVWYVLGKPSAPAAQAPRSPSARTIEAMAAAQEALKDVE